VVNLCLEFEMILVLGDMEIKQENTDGGFTVQHAWALASTRPKICFCLEKMK
jgi:hypothetical protein